MATTPTANPGEIRMRRQTHGAVSLGLFALALAAACQSLFQQSRVLGLLYMFLMGITAPVVLFSFCAKCPDRGQCGHVVPGPAAERLFKNRKQGPYSPGDLFLTAAALAVLVFFPQIWLWRHPLAFLVFWIFMAVAAADIRSKVCKGCGNDHCPGNAGRKRSGQKK
jgi:hypothetical protein